MLHIKSYFYSILLLLNHKYTELFSISNAPVKTSGTSIQIQDSTNCLRKEVSFHTSNLFNTKLYIKDEIIPDSIIEAVHPENGKYNVYVDDIESKWGYLELYFADIDINRIRNSKIILTTSTQEIIELKKEMPYHILKFFIPKGTLKIQQLYKWELIDKNNITLYRSYFRTSKYLSMLSKFEGKIVQVSKSKREGTIVLDEPMDDIEWRNQKNQYRKKLSYFGFPYTSLFNTNPYGSEELEYFFTKPVITDISKLEKEEKTPLEVDHTLGVPFLIKLNQKKFDYNNESIKYCLNFGEYQINEILIKDSIFYYPVVKNVRITESDFKNKKIPQYQNSNIKFRLVSMDIYENIIKNLKPLLLKRLDERAQFFNDTYKHIAYRDNQPYSKTKEDFIKVQIDNAGPWMKKILDADTSYPLLLNYPIKFGITQRLDGESTYGIMAGMPIEWID